MTGIAEVFTKTLPSLEVAEFKVCLLPSISTSVDERPRPLRLILDEP